MPVYFATNRAQTKARWGLGFGSAEGPLRYGVVRISIPVRHEMGEIERPRWIAGEWTEDPRNHFTVLSLSPLSKEKMFADVTGRMAATKRMFATSERAALLFVHGYNVTFEDAAYRTAQVSHDIGFKGATLLYSWPSMGRELAYTYDRTRMDRSQGHIGRFVVDILDHAKPDKLYVVAHSMGARGVTQALSRVALTRPDLKNKIGALILAAPDIDRHVFETEVAPQLSRMAGSVTTYVSGRDKALQLSRLVNGGFALGDPRGGLPIVQDMVTIDASRVDTDFLGHSYFGSEVSLLKDIMGIIGGRKPADRAIRPKPVPPGSYFCFPKENETVC